MDIRYLSDPGTDWWSRVGGVHQVECWPWRQSAGSHGYGQTWDGTTVLLAHRVAWTLMRGPIPADMTIDHLCRNRRCCNPAHMRLMSNVGNASLNGNKVKARCKRGHDNWRVMNNGHRRCITCQDEANARRFH